MRSMMNSLILSLFALLFIAGCGPKPPVPAEDLEFQATMVIEDNGGSVEKDILFTRNMQRVKTVPQGSWIVIVRLDKGLVWTLMPENMLALERPIQPQHKNPLIYLPDKVVSYKKVGEEEVAGHPAIKEDMVIRNEGGENMAIIRWFATDIKWPVKAEAKDGSWKLSYKDIIIGKQDPSLFEVPEGYRWIAGPKPQDGQGG